MDEIEIPTVEEMEAMQARQELQADLDMENYLEQSRE